MESHRPHTANPLHLITQRCGQTGEKHLTMRTDQCSREDGCLQEADQAQRDYQYKDLFFANTPEEAGES